MNTLIVIFLVTLPLVSTHLYYGSSLPQDEYDVGAYDSFSFSIPNDRYKTSDNSSIFLSLSENEQLRPKYHSPKQVSSIKFIIGQFVDVKDDYLYIASSSSIWIFDIAVLSKPFFISQIHSDKSTVSYKKISVSGNYLYIAQGNEGLKIYDITDKYNPKFLTKYYKSIYPSKTAESFDLIVDENDFLYLADNRDGFKILNITNKKNPILVSSVLSKNTGVLHLRKNLLFCGDSDGLVIYNITNKTSPVKLASVSSMKSASDFSSDSEFIYSCSYGLYAAKYGNFSETIKGEEIFDKIYCEELWISEDSDIVFMIDSSMDYVGFHIVNISDKNAAKLLNYYRMNQPHDMYVAANGKYVILATYAGGFRILNTSNYRNLSIIFDAVSYSIEGKASYITGCEETRDIVVDGEYIYLGGTGVFSIFHFDTNSLPQPVYDNRKYTIYSITVAGNLAFLSRGYFGFHIRNISNKSNPILISAEESQKTYFTAVDLTRNLLFCGRDDMGFGIVDISNITNPVIIFELGLKSYQILRMFVVGEFLFAANDRTSLLIFNTTNPKQPVVIGELKLHSPRDVIVRGKYAYIADSTDGIKIADISNYSKPFVVSSIDTDDARKIVLKDNYLFVADEWDFITVVDIEDIPTAKVIETLVLSRIVSLDVKNNFVFVADGSFGMKVFKYKMSIVSSSKFASFCGETNVNIIANDGKTFLVDRIYVKKKSFCYDRGECLPNYRCICSGGYVGDRCETWNCGADFKDLERTCSGHGSCIAPKICDCGFGFAGSNCESNKLYEIFMAPSLSISGIFIISIFVLCFCCCCCILMCLCFVGHTCVCLLGLIVFKLNSSVRKFEKLKNFDILLEEQRLDEDTSIAHVRIDSSLYHIPYSELKIQKIIGEGGSNSVVYKAKWRNQVVAFKCFKTRQICTNQDSYDEFEREVAILASCHHPHILQFIGCSLKAPRVGIVMEFCEKGDLVHFLSTFDETNQYPIAEKYRMCLEMSHAMDFLHSRNIIHRDLKLENVLVTKSESTKIMDFGLSRKMEQINQLKTKMIGTSFYIAPEVVLSETYNEKCDIYSFSIMLYILFTEIMYPFGVETFHIELKVAQDENFRPDMKKLSTCLPEELQWFCKLIARCWDAKSESRPSFSELTEVLESQKPKIVDLEKNQIVDEEVIIQQTGVEIEEEGESENDKEQSEEEANEGEVDEMEKQAKSIEM